MPTATWKNTVIAEAQPNELVTVEGNLYFPLASVQPEHIRASAYQTVCPWKGTASYYDVLVGDEVNANAAWYYATPKDAAKQITGRVAFWKGVLVK